MDTNSKPARSHLVLAILFFAMMALVTIMLLVTALAMWLAELTGSVKFAALIVGAICAAAAAAVYIFSIRKSLENIRSQVDTIYEVAKRVKQGYEWVHRKVELLIRLRDELFGE